MPYSECEVKKDSKKVELMSLTPALTEAAEKLEGSDCRIFMAKIVRALGKGGQRKRCWGGTVKRSVRGNMRLKTGLTGIIFRTEDAGKQKKNCRIY